MTNPVKLGEKIGNARLKMQYWISEYNLKLNVKEE